MAIEMKFSCERSEKDFLKVDSTQNDVIIEGFHNGRPFSIYLDESTAIKFTKTVRTHINIIKGGINV
jgi:hypothetical protein